eukprot:CAMPEP_0177633218 /NCGR_PEP_ID=MMETSP0447-20121125/2718_1 /TAXON_ID=0 /ORGANISM="Stygamoeba regulata, Strain BSH-02190019" /LENGTH=1179 /DNA_ID=CAMNT_0019134859 /DNA_START=78 /DNA_END=3617 /DNA_ORIENTATION=+
MKLGWRATVNPKDKNLKLDDPISLSYAQVEETKSALTDFTSRLQRHSQTTEADVLAGKALAESFNNCGQRFKVIGDLADGADMMGDALRHTAQLITHVEDLRASSNAALDRTLQDHFRSYLQGELVAAKNQKRLYDKTEQQYKAAEAKLQKAKTGRIDHARIFELEKEFNALSATFDQVRVDTTQTLNDTNEQHCQQTLERLADTIHIYHDLFQKGLATIEEFLPHADKMRKFSQSRRMHSSGKPATSGGAALLADESSAASAGGLSGTGAGPSASTSSSSSSSQESSSEVVKQGILFKKGANRRNWQQRWFVLKPKYLFYYVSHQDKKLKGVINLNNCSVGPDTTSKKAFSFTINCKLRTYFIVAKNDQEMKDWIDAIRRCIENYTENEVIEDSGLVAAPIANPTPIAVTPPLATGPESTDPTRAAPPRPTRPKSPRSPHPQPPGLPPLPDAPPPSRGGAGHPMRGGRGAPRGRGGLPRVPPPRPGADGRGPPPTPPPKNTFNKKGLTLIKELIVSEKQYLQNLNSIKVYRFNIQKDVTLAQKIEMKAVFSNSSELFDLHSELLEDFEAVVTKWPRKQMAVVFLGHMESLSLYESYVKNYSTAMNALQNAQKSSASFRNFLKTFEQKHSSQFNLETLLSAPLQRIAKYEMLLEQLMDTAAVGTDDYQTLALAVSKVQALSESIDKCNTLSHQMSKVMDVANKLVGYEGNLVSPNRCLYRDGDLRLQEQADRAPEDVHLFLFNDLLLFTKKSGGLGLRPSFRYHDQLKLHRIAIQEAPGPEPSLHLVKRVGERSEIFTVCFSSRPDKDAWFDAIQHAVADVEKTKVFSVPLKQVMSVESERGRSIPSFLETCIDFIVSYALDVEGIFRLSGKATDIYDAVDALNEGRGIDFDDDTDPHLVAGIIKLWFRELPESLIPETLYDSIMHAMRLPTDEKIQAMRGVLAQLPEMNKFVLQHMVAFLCQVISHEAANKMGLKNISIVFGPNFIKPPGDVMDPMALQEAYSVVGVLMDNYAAFFTEIEKNRLRQAAIFNAQHLKREEEERRKEEELLQILRKKSVSERPPGLRARGQHAVSDQIFHQGYLSKKGANRRNWTTRWFVLKDQCLTYWKSPQDTNNLPKGKIVLKNCLCYKSHKKNFSFAVEVPEQNRIYFICAKNFEEQDQWMELIKTSIEQANNVLM